jgi:hypothetical protein
MMTSTEFGRNGAFGLSRAISRVLRWTPVIRNGAPAEEITGRRRTVSLDTGEPLTIDFLREVAKELRRNIPLEILPENILSGWDSNLGGGVCLFSRS